MRSFGITENSAQQRMRELSISELIPAKKGEAVVALTLYDGKCVLLRQYRHAMRDFQYAFPRGFGTDGLSAEENAEKEVAEELGAKIIKSERIGTVVADSGISGNAVAVVLCHVDGYKLKTDYEGICDVELLSFSEMEEWIADEKINDGFTLAALSLYKSIK